MSSEEKKAYLAANPEAGNKRYAVVRVDFVCCVVL